MIAFLTVERLFCFGQFDFPSYAFALLIKRPSCIFCISTANIALRTRACFTLKHLFIALLIKISEYFPTCKWKNACEFACRNLSLIAPFPDLCLLVPFY